MDKEMRMMSRKDLGKLLVVAMVLVFCILLTSACAKKAKNTATRGTVATTAKAGTAATAAKTTSRTTFTASTAKEDTGSQTAPGEIQTEEPGDASTEEPVSGGEAQEIVIDLGGRTLRSGAWTNYFDLAMFNGDGFSIKQAKAIVEEKYNCKFEWEVMPVGYGQYFIDLKVNLLAGTLRHDVIMARDDVIFPWATKGAVWALEDLLDGPGEWDAIKNHTGSYAQWMNGKHYGFWNEDTVQLHAATLYNPAILSANGIPDIRNDYMAEGQWNWSTLLEIAITTTRDVNGDGMTDVWGIANTAADLGVALVYSNGGKFITFDFEKQKAELSMYTRPVINALQFLSDLYNTYRVVTTNYQNMVNGNAAMILYNPYAYGMNNFTPGKNPNNVDLALLPIGTDASDYTYGELNVCRFLSIPATTQKPKEAALAWAALLTEYRRIFQEEDIVYRKGAARARDIKVTNDKNIDFYGRYDFTSIPVYNREGLFPSFTSLRNTLFNQVISLKPVSMAMAEIAPQIQSHLNDVMAAW
ncbi:MAG TPA: hypothetical protein DD727_09415 [Clostridiales bacterium]|nr:hypothetical protein [Clostridiales bacterium]